MKRAAAIIIFLFISSLLFAQQDTTKVKEEKKPTQASKVYYGGELGFNIFGDTFRIRVAPLIGYKLSPKASVGAKIAYEYLKYSNDATAHNYGASVFGRYRVIPQIYLHGEFVYASYEYPTIFSETVREWVPFLLLGGGYLQPIGPRTFAYVEVLFDVLQDNNSPYNQWDPFVSFGVSVGF